MNREELDKRNTAAITHWWVTMRDTGKVAPGLLADLAGIADKHAADHAGRVTARRELRAETATTLRDDYDSTPAPAAADTDPETPPADTETTTGPSDRSSARTRTRTRRNTA
jgi:hypothetical protein